MVNPVNLNNDPNTDIMNPTESISIEMKECPNVVIVTTQQKP